MWWLSCVHVICHGRKEKWNELCYEWKSWGSHACMHVIYIEILLRYIMLVRTRTFDIYVHHDIMRAFLFLWQPATCNALFSTKSGSWGTYTIHKFDQWLTTRSMEIHKLTLVAVFISIHEEVSSCSSRNLGKGLLELGLLGGNMNWTDFNRNCWNEQPP